MKELFIAKVLTRLAHPGRPSKIKVQTLFEKVFLRELKKPH